MTINNANVEQINVALLDIDKRIKALNADSEAIKSLQNSVKTIKGSLNETKAGLQSGATYNINISGNASTATHATTATTAEVVNVAESAAEAGHAKLADKATSDANGNNIVNTYATKTELVKAVPSHGTADKGKTLIVNSDGTGTEWHRLIKYHSIDCGDVTIPSNGYVEFGSYLNDNEEPISAVVDRWVTNTGAFYVTAYTGNPMLFYVVGTPGVVVKGLKVRIYCVDKVVLVS